MEMPAPSLMKGSETLFPFTFTFMFCIRLTLTSEGRPWFSLRVMVLLVYQGL